MVRLEAEVYRQLQGESFTKKLDRLKMWHQSTLTKTKPQNTPN